MSLNPALGLLSERKRRTGCQEEALTRGGRIAAAGAAALYSLTIDAWCFMIVDRPL